MLNIAVVALLQRFRKRFPPSLTVAQQNIVLGPFAFVITLYAFLLSFVVINLWQSFSQAQRTAVIEAETVAVLYQLTESLLGAQGSRQTMTQYVRSVVQDEWPAMADGKTSPKTEALYNQIWQDVRDLVPSTVKEQLLYAELLDQLRTMGHPPPPQNRRSRCHCERSDAISARQHRLLRRLSLLAMTLSSPLFLWSSRVLSHGP